MTCHHVIKTIICILQISSNNGNCLLVFGMYRRLMWVIGATARAKIVHCLTVEERERDLLHAPGRRFSNSHHCQVRGRRSTATDDQEIQNTSMTTTTTTIEWHADTAVFNPVIGWSTSKNQNIAYLNLFMLKNCNSYLFSNFSFTTILHLCVFKAFRDLKLPISKRREVCNQFGKTCFPRLRCPNVRRIIFYLTFTSTIL